MRYTDNFTDYELIDCTDGERLERWNDIVLIRPDPQVIWNTGQASPFWSKAHARYIRNSSGGGRWEFYKKLPTDWTVSFGRLKFKVRPTNFKHTGLFPEQGVNWEMYDKLIKNAERDIKVLNLFAYTGGATLACASAGASVCHIDAAKGMVIWAKENAELSGLSDSPIRYIVDDVRKFLEREIRRGSRYDGIIMDPPSYGRGKDGEVWKLESEIYKLLSLAASVLADKPLFFVVNSYTTGLSPRSMAYMLDCTAGKVFGTNAEADEIGIRVSSTGRVLPAGGTSMVVGD
jgi:23S rRNA (cytosine1962-C5)-methyltransferase